MGSAPRRVDARGDADQKQSLMAEILEDHIRLHITHPDHGTQTPEELTEDLIDLVRAYLK